MSIKSKRQGRGSVQQNNEKRRMRGLKDGKDRREGLDVDTHTAPPHVGSSSLTETIADFSGPR